jgi:phosphoribosyl-AMP cyclohydrolase / phosphoribosyl-ATP pyrophosphohydrolase
MKINTNKINWKKVDGLLPAVIQDVGTGAVLMLGYMDKTALAKTKKTGFVWFYSRTKKRLWKKGETSGNTLRVKDIKLDCDGDTLLVSVIPSGPVCHTGTVSCFGNETGTDAIRELFAMIEKRKIDMPKGSYTASLFKAGLNRIALKVSEESLEVVQSATKETKKRLVEESIDLIYHLFVLLSAKAVTLNTLENEIRKRRVGKVK